MPENQTNPKWWKEDWSQELTIFVVGVIAITALVVLGDTSNEIVAALGGGLVGFLVGKKMNGGT
jgi:hypothetical protein